MLGFLSSLFCFVYLLLGVHSFTVYGLGCWFLFMFRFIVYALMRVKEKKNGRCLELVIILMRIIMQ